VISSKTCRGCDLEKATTEFHADTRAADGFGNYCRPCKVDRARVRRTANRGAGNVATRPQRSSSSTRPTYEIPWGRSTPTLDEGIESAVTVATRSTEIAAALRNDGFGAQDVESISMLVCGFDDSGGEAGEE
jgi:hypothetical protein